MASTLKLHGCNFEITWFQFGNCTIEKMNNSGIENKN